MRALCLLMSKSKTKVIPVSQEVVGFGFLALVSAIMLIFFLDEYFTYGHMTPSARVKTMFPDSLRDGRVLVLLLSAGVFRDQYSIEST